MSADRDPGSTTSWSFRAIGGGRSTASGDTGGVVDTGGGGGGEGEGVSTGFQCDSIIICVFLATGGGGPTTRDIAGGVVDSGAGGGVVDSGAGGGVIESGGGGGGGGGEGVSTGRHCDSTISLLLLVTEGGGSVVSGDTSVDTGDGVLETGGGGGGGGGGDVPRLSLRRDERFFLSSLGGRLGSVGERGDGLPDNECRFFKGRGGRSSEVVLCKDDIV